MIYCFGGVYVTFTSAHAGVYISISIKYTIYLSLITVDLFCQCSASVLSRVKKLFWLTVVHIIVQISSIETLLNMIYRPTGSGQMHICCKSSELLSRNF